jgi:hypothetical protein
MKNTHKLLEYQEFDDQNMRDRLYYEKYYKKNQHEGAESGTIMYEPDIKIKVFGINDLDNSKSESGKMHVHIYTEYGESEYYVNGETLSYKDGYRLPDSYIKDLTIKMKKDNPIVCNCETHFRTVQMGWDFENEENNRTL